VDGDGLIVVGVAVLIFIGVAYGLYSRSGSDIDEHPLGPEHGDRDESGPPGLS
jgi:hypothetical protein